MDIAALSMNLSQMEVAQGASVSVMKMAMDVASKGAINRLSKDAGSKYTNHGTISQPSYREKYRYKNIAGENLQPYFCKKVFILFKL